MTLRMKYKVRPQIFASAEEKDKYLHLDDTISERTIDTFTKQMSGNPTITQSTSEDLSLGDLTTVVGCWVEVSHECTVKFNGSSDAITLKPTTDQNSASSARFFMEASITQIEITAPASQDISVRYGVWGS